MRVIELLPGPSARFAGMLLAELGADVIQVEPTEGKHAPSGGGTPIDDSATAYLDRRKRRLRLDLSRRRGRNLLMLLATRSDAIVEDLGPGGLGRLRLSYRRLRRTNPDIVVASISPFGGDGPHSGWQASELVVQAMGGIVQATGWDGEPPLKLAGYPAHFIAGLHAATAIQAAVFGVESGTETGVHIDVSAEEAFLHHWSRHIGQWAYGGLGTRREPRSFGRQGFPHTVMAADGWLYILALNAEWEALAFFLGLEPFITHEWTEPSVRAQRWPEIEPHFHASIAGRSKYDWFTGAAEQGYTFAPIDDPAALLRSPQLAERGFFKTATVDGQTVPSAGLPFSFAGQEPATNRVHAPGEDNAEVLAGLLGLTHQEIQDLERSGVI